MCKKSKFEHTTEWYRHKPEAVLENESHQVSWDFVIQTNPVISAIRPDRVITKKVWHIVDFGVLANHRGKMKENEMEHTSLDLARDLRKPWDMRVSVIPFVIGAYLPGLRACTLGFQPQQNHLEYVSGWISMSSIDLQCSEPPGLVNLLPARSSGIHVGSLSKG